MEQRISAMPLALLGAVVYLTAVAARLPIALTKPVDGDESAQGIAALRLIEDGQWNWFFPAQKHGGTLETIPQGLLQLIDQGSVFLLRLPIVLIAAGGALVLALLALELTRSRLTFVAVGVLASFFPPVYVFLGSWQTAGYNASTFLSALAVYLLARALRPAVSGGRRSLLVAAAGLTAGLAFYEQPMAVFLIAALGTTALVATWPRAVELLRPRHLGIFVALALLGAGPEIVSVLGGLETNNAYNPLPPDYRLTPSLLLAVGGVNFHDSAGLPEIGFRGGYESMTWNALGVQWLDNMLVPRALAVALAAVAWAWILGTVVWAVCARVRRIRAQGPHRHRARAVGAGPSPTVAVAAGALVAAVLITLAVTNLPPLAKYAFGLSGFAAFGLAILATQLLPCHPAAGRLFALGILALVGGSVYTTIETAYDGGNDALHEQRSWLLNEIDATPTGPERETVLYGDYWIAYPLEFMSGDTLEARVPRFNRFPDQGADGEAPTGRVIIPVVPDLAFQPEVDTTLRDRCGVLSTRVDGDAKVLVAECRVDDASPAPR